jgi:hypothetical protein
MTTTSTTLIACCLLTGAAFGCETSDGSHLSQMSQAGTSAAASSSGAAGKPADSAVAGGKAADAEPLDHHTDIRGKCALQTDFADDHACIPAPDPKEGFQIHIGPKDYNDPEEVAKFILHPGEETSECFTYKTPNDQKIFYQTAMLSGRAGTHHIIHNMYDKELETGSFGPCADQQSAIGSLPGASKPYMPRGTVAPEYAHVGHSIPAHATGQADMHYFNFTEKDILREVWINIYYADEKDIEEESSLIVGFGGVGWTRAPIQPGTDKVYQYSCPVKGEGHLLSLLGHYHSHGKRFTASIKRASGSIERVFEMFDYLEPALFEYNSVIENPTFAEGSSGATTGDIALHDGDTMLWECHIINDSDVGLTYTNFVKTGEMCNLWGTTIGVEQLRCYLP